MEVTEPQDFDTRRKERRAILKRSAMYSFGLMLTTGAVALAGGAAIAGVLSLRGMPFLYTWLAVSAIVLLLPVLAHVWRAVRQRR